VTISRPAVLFFVTRFPPQQEGVSVIRALKFSKYLPLHGWAPIVVVPSARRPASVIMEPVPEGVRVVRTLSIATPSTVASRILGGGDDPDALAWQSSTGEADSRELGAVSSLARWTLAMADIPDDGIGWFPFGVMAGLRQLWNHDVRAVFATGPPFSAVFTGSVVAALAGKRLVLDFRDCWTLDPLDPFGAIQRFRAPSSKLRVRIIRALERWCLSRADVVLFAAPTATELYASTFPELASKMHTVLNGADPDDFESKVELFDQVTVSHTGMVHDYQSEQVAACVRGFAGLVKSLAPGTARPRMVFLGNAAPAVTRMMVHLIRELDVVESVELRGRVSHREAVAWMQRSHGLVLFDGGNPLVRPSKLSEYWGAGAAAFGFCSPGSPTEEEILKYGGSVASGPEQADLFEAWVKSLVLGEHPIRREVVFPPGCDRPGNAAALAALLAKT
jgi:hypothetical protein